MSLRSGDAGWIAALMLLLILAYVPLSPAYPSNPNRDAGAFLYAGSEVLSGAIPYRDFWDHKPPLIYYLNALGLSFTPGSWWGVWIVEVASLAAALLLAWGVLRRFGVAGATVGSMLWIAANYVCSIAGRGGNLTENYALLPQFAAVAIWRGRHNDEISSRDAFLLGTTCALAFLLKPPLIGPWVVLAVLMAARPGRALLRIIVYGVLGLAWPIALFALYFGLNGALAESIDMIFHYNAVYSRFATARDRWSAVSYALRLMQYCGATVAYIYWVYSVARPRRLVRGDAIVLFAVLALPVDLVLVSMAGRQYEHYSIALLPSLAILTAAAFAEVLAVVPLRHLRVGLLAASLAGLVLLKNPLSDVSRGLRLLEDRNYIHAARRNLAVQWVRSHVAPGQYVLMWGAEPSVNFLANRRSPTLYMYQLPLMTTGYGDPASVARFIADLDRHRPAVIIDTSRTEPIFVPLDRQRRERWSPHPAYVPPPEFMEAVKWIHRHYRLDGTLRTGWDVYVPR